MTYHFSVNLSTSQHSTEKFTFAVGFNQHRDPQLARVQRIKGYRKFSPSENFINCSKDLEITAERKG